MPTSSSASKCPFAGVAAVAHPEATTGGEMCSHARRKFAAAEQEASVVQVCPHHQPPSNLVEGGSKQGDSNRADWTSATSDELKTHFTAAYNDNALHASSKQWSHEHVARVLMERLGYDEAQLRIIGPDVALMQGTGNPHQLAAVAAGETVVDLGSGFGLDAFLASAKCGPSGRVIGVDLSIKEVTAAITKSSQRRLQNVDFRLGDIEDLPITTSSVDVVISNGGFCLVPNKKKGFEEVFRVLRPGGRFTVSCTVRLGELQAGLPWPSCMVVFMPLSDVHRTLTEIGFEHIVIDDSNSRMDVWDGDDNSKANKGPAASAAPLRTAESNDTADVASTELDAGVVADAKLTIHKGDERYRFLKEMDMSALFARVNIFGRKPNR